MRIGIITGSGAYAWPSITRAETTTASTAFGEVDLTEGVIDGVDVVHVSRHGRHHARLSHLVQHKANLAALLERDVEALVSLTVCGALRPDDALGSLIVFDDLYFPDNRLPDGSHCSWHSAPDQEGRGHWIFDTPFSQPLREQALTSARALEVVYLDGGCYGHVEGPRFNTRTEIAALARLGIRAVSQTAGPEVVLAGEAELPMVLLGYLTDYANGVSDPQPVEQLQRYMEAGGPVFQRVVDDLVTRIENAPPPTGVNYRFG